MKTKLTLLTLLLILLSINTNALATIDDAVIIKNNDIQTIDAALRHPTTGKAHFFVGEYWHRYNMTSQKLERWEPIGKNSFKGIPKNLDAALVHPINKKGYFFKGNMYYRYDFAKRKVDKKGIVGVDGWKGLNGPFDAAVVHPTNNKAYFFKGNKYYSYDFGTKKVVVKNTGKDGWKGVPGNLDAAIMHNNGKTYFFKGDFYHRYNFSRRAIDNLNSIIGRDGWHLFHKLDAVVESDYDKKNRIFEERYIIGKYVYYNKREEDEGFFLSTPNVQVKKKRFGYDWFLGVPPNIDAGFRHPINNKYYFFKGDTYYRYNANTRRIDKTAKIKKGFGIARVQAAAAVPNSNDIYLFLNDYYFLYDISKSKIVTSGKIASKFKGVPNNIDAAQGNGEHSLIFYKKNTMYNYYSQSKKSDTRRIPYQIFK